jgi:hypothetical protein
MSQGWITKLYKAMHCPAFHWLSQVWLTLKVGYGHFEIEKCLCIAFPSHLLEKAMHSLSLVIQVWITKKRLCLALFKPSTCPEKAMHSLSLVIQVWITKKRLCLALSKPSTCPEKAMHSLSLVIQVWITMKRWLCIALLCFSQKGLDIAGHGHLCSPNFLGYSLVVLTS